MQISRALNISTYYIYSINQLLPPRSWIYSECCDEESMAILNKGNSCHPLMKIFDDSISVLAAIE